MGGWRSKGDGVMWEQGRWEGMEAEEVGVSGSRGEGRV